MLDMIRDMRYPLEFNKSVWASQLFMFINYAGEAIVDFFEWALMSK